jgi:hypothetical protein
MKPFGYTIILKAFLVTPLTSSLWDVFHGNNFCNVVTSTTLTRVPKKLIPTNGYNEFSIDF